MLIKVACLEVLILTCHTLNFTYFTGQVWVAVGNATIDSKVHIEPLWVSACPNESKG